MTIIAMGSWTMMTSRISWRSGSRASMVILEEVSPRFKACCLWLTDVCKVGHFLLAKIDHYLISL